MPIGKQKCISTATSTSRGLDRDDCRKTGTAMRHLVNTKELWRMLIHWMKYICTTGNCLHLKLKLFMTTVTLAQPKHVSNWPIVLSSARSRSDLIDLFVNLGPKNAPPFDLLFYNQLLEYSKRYENWIRRNSILSGLSKEHLLSFTLVESLASFLFFITASKNSLEMEDAVKLESRDLPNFSIFGFKKNHPDLRFLKWS